jgi:hypothetical protein
VAQPAAPFERRRHIVDAPTSRLPTGYVVDLLEPDVWILRREEDGSLVAAFNMHSATEADLWIAATKDEQSRTAVDRKKPLAG